MQQQQKFGVQEIKELATAGAKIGSGVGAVMADGEVNWRDSVHLPKILSGLKDLPGVDFRALVPEVKDLDEAEKADLAAHFNATFDLPNDSVEVVVEQGLELTLSVVQALLAFVKIGAKVKAAA